MEQIDWDKPIEVITEVGRIMPAEVVPTRGRAKGNNYVKYSLAPNGDERISLVGPDGTILINASYHISFRNKVVRESRFFNVYYAGISGTFSSRKEADDGASFWISGSAAKRLLVIELVFEDDKLVDKIFHEV